MNDLTASSYYKCLSPLLDGLDWKGEESALKNAIPFRCQHYGVDQFVETMANLGHKSHETKVNLKRHNFPITPCLLVSDGEVPRVLLHKVGDVFLSYSGQIEKFEQFQLKNKVERVLYFYRDEENSNNLLNQQTNWFFKFLVKFKPIFLQSFVVSFILSLLALMSPLLVMTIYGQITIANVRTNITFLAAGIVLLIVAFMGFTFFKGYLLNYLGARMSFIVNTEVIRRLVYLPPAMSENASLGAQLSRLKDFDSIKSFFTGVGFGSILDLPFVIVLLLAIYFLGGYIVVVPISAMILFLVLGSVYGPMTQKINALNSSVGKERNDFIYESITNVRSLVDSGLKEEWIAKYKKLNIHSILSSRDSAIVTQTINILSTTIVSIAALATIALGVNKAIAGELSIGALMAIVLLLWKVLNPLKSFFSVMAQYDKIKSSVKQIDRFMNLPLEMGPLGKIGLEKSTKGEITFNQVALRYSADVAPALMGINFKINPGETLVIYGHSGSGKSTIIKILLGMLNAQAGRVLIDGVNIRQINPARLRTLMSYCPQESLFFYETIYENLMKAKSTATQEEIDNLLKRFLLNDEMDRFEFGINTVMNMNTKQFSDRVFLKKLSLVRTFLKDSSIYLIDDLSRDLNGSFEERAISYLEGLKGKKTIIVTTSDPSQFELADKVLWLDRGKIRMYGKADKAREFYKSSQKRGANDQAKAQD